MRYKGSFLLLFLTVLRSSSYAAAGRTRPFQSQISRETLSTGFRADIEVLCSPSSFQSFRKLT